MMTVLLTIVAVLAAAGLAATIWASRGGAPRWVRGIAKATIATADVAASMNRANRRRNSRYTSGSYSGDPGGGDGGGSGS
ncbi:hypothetical protein ACFYO9_23800 [Streptomyces sp. NPDC005863]|uniref:hypothetical protein n=1 Tax=unclassified Streptomyces TaxID=2593676 RepID=UPI0033DB81AA